MVDAGAKKFWDKRGGRSFCFGDSFFIGKGKKKREEDSGGGDDPDQYQDEGITDGE